MAFRSSRGAAYSPRPLAASRARSAAATAGPAVFRAAGEAGVRGCGRVGAVFLACSILSPQVAGFLGAERRAQLWPDLGFLVADVLAAGLDDRGDQLLELRFAGLGLVQLVEDFFALLLFVDGGVGQVAPVGDLSRTVGQKYISSTASCLGSSITSCSTSFFRRARSLSSAPVAAVGPASSSASICLTSSWSWPSTSNTFGVVVPPSARSGCVVVPFPWRPG
jgi:hypothetical protein